MIILKDGFRDKLPLLNEYDSIEELANSIKLMLDVSVGEFDLTSDDGCFSLINWYLDDYQMSFDKVFTISQSKVKTNLSRKRLKVNFYFTNTNNNESFEKIKELINLGYSCDFDENIEITNMEDIKVIMIDGNKCIGLINHNEYNEQRYRFKNFKKIII